MFVGCDHNMRRRARVSSDKLQVLSTSIAGCNEAAEQSDSNTHDAATARVALTPPCR
jgi:hypothetical protein